MLSQQVQKGLSIIIDDSLRKAIVNLEFQGACSVTGGLAGGKKIPGLPKVSLTPKQIIIFIHWQ